MRWLLCALLAPVLCAAAEKPRDFAFGVPVQTDGREALYEIVLPASLYQGVTRPDLGDMRVFNADGEPVPFALEPKPPRRSEKPHPVAVKFFPLYGEQPADLQGLQLRVEKGAGGTVVSVKSDAGKRAAHRSVLAYLVDLSALKQPYEALELDWRQDSASSATTLRVEASDDLEHWTTVASQAPLVRLDYGGQRLEQRAVEFHPRTAKYLRLTWPASGRTEALDITSVMVRTGEIALEPERAWRELLPKAGEKPGEYLYDLGGPLPVDRVRIGLPQDNSIARIELLSRPDARSEWRPLASGVVYRLTQSGQQVASPDLSVAPNVERYWLLRADQRGGGLGSGMPRLTVGWVPQRLVFAARGQGPFQLAYGSAKMQPAAYPVETVVPGWRSDQQPTLARAELLPERLLGGTAALRTGADYKVWGLWAVLSLGVLLLAWMTWRLARQMRSAPAAEIKTDSKS
jgi:hypothetical protein